MALSLVVRKGDLAVTGNVTGENIQCCGTLGRRREPAFVVGILEEEKAVCFYVLVPYSVCACFFPNMLVDLVLFTWQFQCW